MDSQTNDTVTSAPAQTELDVATLIDKFDGDAEMLGIVSEVFLQEYPSQLSAVREAVHQQDASAVARSSHTLKGSIGVFGAESAYEMARRLESFGRATDLTLAERTYADLEQQVTRLGQLLATLPCPVAA